MRSPALNYITPNPAQSWRWQPLRIRQCLRLCKIENPLRKSLRQRTFLGLSKKRTRHETSEWRRKQAPALNLYYTVPAQSWRWLLLRNRRCLRLCKIENPLRKSLRQRTFLGLSKKRTRHETGEWRRKQAPALNLYYTSPCAIIALATFTKPAMFAPAT